MKFKEILYEWLLVENKEQVYQKFYSDIERTNFIRIIKADPKTIVTDNKIINIGKHSRLLLDIYRKGQLRFEDLIKANEYLTIVYEHNIRLDYKTINSISDIFEYVKHKIPKIAVTIEQILDALDKNEYEIKYNGPKWFVVTPKTEKASSYLGVNTEWCTTWGKYCLNPKYKDRENHFNSHNAQGPLYIIINKTNINEKYQLHFESNQLKGVEDKEVPNRPNFFDSMPDVKLYFFPSLSEKSGVETLKDDMDRSKKFLSVDDIKYLLSRFIETFGDKTNDLFNNFLNKDVDSILEKIVKESGLTELSFNDYDDVIFEFKELPSSLDDVYRGISWLESEHHYSYDRMYEDESYYFKQDGGHEIMDQYLLDYYEKNKSDLITKFGNVSKTYDSFKKTFLDGVVQSDFVSEKYLEKHSELNANSYNNAINSELEQINTIISFDMGYRTFKTVNVSLIKILEFISQKNITTINNLNYFFEDFSSYFDLPNENFFPEIDYNREFPDNDFMNDILEDYFDDLYENFKDEYDDDEINEECLKKRSLFFEIVGEKFDENYTFENQFVKIIINDNWLSTFDCQKGVIVTFTNKKSNQTHKGYMQITSILNNMNIEPLLEKIMDNIITKLKKGVI